MSENTKKLKTVLDEQGKNLHREIDNAIKKLKTDVDETENKYLSVLDKHEDEIKRKISEIIQNIADVKKLLCSNDVSLVSSYKSSIAKFRRLPSKITVSLPSLSSQKINEQQIYEQFGILSAVGITPEDCASTSNSLKSMFSQPDKRQLREEEDMDEIPSSTSSPGVIRIDADCGPVTFRTKRPGAAKRYSNKALEWYNIGSQEDEIHCPKCNRTCPDMGFLQIHLSSHNIKSRPTDL